MIDADIEIERCEYRGECREGHTHRCVKQSGHTGDHTLDFGDNC